MVKVIITKLYHRVWLRAAEGEPAKSSRISQRPTMERHKLRQTAKYSKTKQPDVSLWCGRKQKKKDLEW